MYRPAFEIYVTDGVITLIDPDASGSAVPDAWDDMYVGRVWISHHKLGVWWPSVVTYGWELQEQGTGTKTREVDTAIADWLSRVPEIVGVPKRATRATRWIMADAATLLLFFTAVLSVFKQRHWLVSKRAAQYCGGCGYDLVGLTEFVCPECGQPVTPPDRAVPGAPSA